MIEFILTFVTLLLRTKDHEEKMRNIIQEMLNIFTYNDKRNRISKINWCRSYWNSGLWIIKDSNKKIAVF